jgi:hypothetical protein
MLIFILVLACVVVAYWYWAQPITMQTNAVKNPGSLQNYPKNAQSAPCSEQINLIKDAIALGRDVSFRYAKTDGSVTQRTVTPFELRKLSISELQSLIGVGVAIRREGGLCMFGRCHLRGADRVFAIERIQNLRLE